MESLTQVCTREEQPLVMSYNIHIRYSTLSCADAPIVNDCGEHLDIGSEAVELADFAAVDLVEPMNYEEVI